MLSLTIVCIGSGLCKPVIHNRAQYCIDPRQSCKASALVKLSQVVGNVRDIRE